MEEIKLYTDHDCSGRVRDRNCWHARIKVVIEFYVTTDETAPIGRGGEKEGAEAVDGCGIKEVK